MTLGVTKPGPTADGGDGWVSLAEFILTSYYRAVDTLRLQPESGAAQ
jgi:hypothetical protein